MINIKNYKEHLYCPYIYLKESNLSVLNEIYFGKTSELKLLENYLDEYVKICNQNKHFSFTCKALGFASSKSNIDDILINKRNNDKRKEEIKIAYNLLKTSIFPKIEKALKKEFGFSIVNINISSSAGSITGTTTENKYIKQQDEILCDAEGRKIKIKDLIKTILVNNKGIKFNPKKFSIEITLNITNPGHIVNDKLNSRELLSVILHEIGHVFSRAFLFYTPYSNDDIKKYNLSMDKLYARQNEIFADKFVSLYGYSTDFVSFFHKIHTMHKTGYDYKSDISNLIQKNTNDNVTDVHPQVYIRLISLLQQLKIEERNKSLSAKQRQEITTEIKRLKEKIKEFKYDPIIDFDNTSDKDIEKSAHKFYKDKHTQDLMINLSSDQDDRTYQKYSKINSNYITSRLNNIHMDRYNKNDLNYYSRSDTLFNKNITDNIEEYSDIKEFVDITKSFLDCDKNKFMKLLPNVINKYFENQIEWYKIHRISVNNINKILRYIYDNTINNMKISGLIFDDNPTSYTNEELLENTVDLILALFLQPPNEVCIQAEYQLFGKLL